MQKTNLISILIIGGSVVLLIGVFLFANKLQFLSNSTRTQGEVIKLIQKKRPLNRQTYESTFVYFPLVSFSTIEGQKMTFESNFGGDLYHVKDLVTVIYDRDNPQRAEIYAFFPLWFASLLLSIIGTIFLIIGIILRKKLKA